MTDIKLNTTNAMNHTNVSMAPQKNSAAVSPAKVPDITTPKQPAYDEVKTKEFGPIIAKSEDGDTVRVKIDAAQEKSSTDDSSTTEDYGIQDFTLSPKEDSSTEEDMSTKEEDETPAWKEVIEEELSKEPVISDEITSFVGYSDSELKQLYLKGEISLMDFDSELESRQAQREAMAIENSKFTAGMMKNNADFSKILQAADSIDNISSDEGESTIPIEIRMQAMASLDTL
ncbi:MAG: hypothetical protein K6F66_05510 [Pseudobutyrivibrio sp.]|nr:hypothetical protein [Pseudobutyrivibrio sp.]